MSLKNIWKKVTDAFAVEPDKNGMNVYDVQYIDKKVREQTNFEVGALGTRTVGGRRNVGLVMPVDTPAEEVKKAEDVFISAAKDRGLEIDRSNILRYVPGTIRKPNRIVQERPQTWR